MWLVGVNRTGGGCFLLSEGSFSLFSWCIVLQIKWFHWATKDFKCIYNKSVTHTHNDVLLFKCLRDKSQTCKKNKLFICQVVQVGNHLSRYMKGSTSLLRNKVYLSFVIHPKKEYLLEWQPIVHAGSCSTQSNLNHPQPLSPKTSIGLLKPAAIYMHIHYDNVTI